MSKQVLLVDDKPEIAKIIMLYLATYEIKYVENPVKAIAWLKEGNMPDLIISDLNMPEMSGEEFLRYIKTDENTIRLRYNNIFNKRSSSCGYSCSKKF